MDSLRKEIRKAFFESHVGERKATGVMEFSHPDADFVKIQRLIRRIEGFLEELRVYYWYVNPNDNIVYMNVEDDMSEEIKRIMENQGFFLQNETWGDEEREAKNPGSIVGAQNSNYGSFASTTAHNGTWQPTRLVGEF